MKYLLLSVFLFFFAASAIPTEFKKLNKSVKKKSQMRQQEQLCLDVKKKIDTVYYYLFKYVISSQIEKFRNASCDLIAAKVSSDEFLLKGPIFSLSYQKGAWLGLQFFSTAGIYYRNTPGSRVIIEATKTVIKTQATHQIAKLLGALSSKTYTQWVPVWIKDQASATIAIGIMFLIGEYAVPIIANQEIVKRARNGLQYIALTAALCAKKRLVQAGKDIKKEIRKNIKEQEALEAFFINKWSKNKPNVAAPNYA